MTHPTPTTAPKAPPLPLRGEGMGVGGLALALAIALTSPAGAQVASTGTPAADILLGRAIAEHRTFLTCSALDPATHARITANWQRDVTAAAAILSANQVPPEAVAAFTAAADPANLLPAPDTSFEDLRQFCTATPDWQERYAQLNLTILDLKLPQAFE
jgi:hypothetical protein